jgi:hypothetical protein
MRKCPEFNYEPCNYDLKKISGYLIAKTVMLSSQCEGLKDAFIFHGDALFKNVLPKPDDDNTFFDVVVAHLPLGGAQPIEGLPLLPPISLGEYLELGGNPRFVGPFYEGPPGYRGYYPATDQPYDGFYATEEEAEAWCQF